MPFARVNGIRLYYEDHGKGTPLVLVMGYGDGCGKWAKQMPAFARRHRVIAFDNRGGGKTDAPRSGYSIRTFAEDTIGLMDHLGIDRAHLCGYSMGGRIAQDVAIRHPGRLRSLILCATSARPSAFNKYTLWLDMVLVPRYGPGAVAPFGPIYQYTRAWFEKHYRALVANLRRRPKGDGAPVHGLIGQAKAILTHDTSRDLGRIRAPTLVLVGDQDLLNPPPESEVLAKRIPGARLRVLRGGGHGFLWEIPERFNTAVLDFTSRVDAGGGAKRPGPARGAGG